MLPTLLMRSIPFRNFGLLLTLSISQLSFSQAKRDASPTQHTRTNHVVGRTLFNSSCAACHGLDGHGSDKAVNIATNARMQHLTDDELAKVISNGLPGTGMPAFRTLSGKQVHDIVGYVRLLQGRVSQVNLPGDAKKGKEIFFGKGECASCHTIEGAGGFLGPDLTGHGSISSVEAMREEIVKSPRVPAPGYRTARLTIANGQQLEGTIRNEDNFSVQLQTKDGSFHFFKKAELQSFEFTGRSFMPTDYRQRLSDAELNDLVSYLVSVSRKQKVTRVMEKDELE